MHVCIHRHHAPPRVPVHRATYNNYYYYNYNYNNNNNPGILMNPDWVTDERLDPSLADAEHPNGKWVPNARRPGQITPEDLPRLAVQHPVDMSAGAFLFA